MDTMMHTVANGLDKGGLTDDRTADGTTTPSSSGEYNSHGSAPEQEEEYQQHIGRPLGSGHHFPSSASLESSTMWSSSENQSGSSDFTGEDDDSEDYSSDEFSDSDEDDDYSSLADEFEGYDQKMMPPRRPRQQQHQPQGFPARPAPGGGGGGLPAGIAGLLSRPPPQPSAGVGAATPGPPLPMPPAMEGLPFGGAEGLPFTLESLKKDLAKVGQAIISSNAGAVAAERAQTLASINWLASHVPNAVLDKLGHEIRDNLDNNEDDEELDAEEKSGGVAEKLQNIYSSEDSLSEVSDLSHNEDDESEEEEETMKIVEPADVPNVQISYGDLGTFAHTQASTFLPEHDSMPPSGLLPEIDEINPTGNPLLSPVQRQVKTATRTNSILNALPMKGSASNGRSILDNIPIKKGSEGTPSKSSPPLPPNASSSPMIRGRRSSVSTVTTTTSTTSSKGSKGVKGLFRRFKKGTKDYGENKAISPLDTGLPPKPPAIRPDAQSNPLQRPMNTNQSSLMTKSNPPETVRDKRALPYSTKYRCALLFVDISGFTKLSRLLDPESLSKVSFRFRHSH
jgi:hypothetical protein